MAASHYRNFTKNSQNWLTNWILFIKDAHCRFMTSHKQNRYCCCCWNLWNFLKRLNCRTPATNCFKAIFLQPTFTRLKLTTDTLEKRCWNLFVDVTLIYSTKSSTGVFSFCYSVYRVVKRRSKIKQQERRRTVPTEIQWNTSFICDKKEVSPECVIEESSVERPSYNRQVNRSPQI